MAVEKQVMGTHNSIGYVNARECYFIDPIVL